MDITAMPPAAASSRPRTEATANADGSGTSSKGTISSDFDTFLKMLTAQINNQDPLSPMKTEEFATQLATFSGVEQQVLTNDLLEGLSARLGAGDLSQMASWVGMEARARMPVQFDGNPVTVDPEPPAAGDRHHIVVTDAFGAEVDRRKITATGDPFQWDGVGSASGAPLPAGIYRFTVESFDDAGTLVATEPAETYGRVVEARAGRDGATLVFAGGTEVVADDVTALRQAFGTI